MARNKTLLKLLNDVRAEARLSLNSAHNVQVRDSHVNIIQREQERLWEDFAWPHLRVQRFLPLQAGQRFYDLASCTNELGEVKGDLSIDRVETIEVKTDGEWLRLGAGTIGAPQYAAHDSGLGERAWSPRLWKLSEDEQIEIWPVPDQDAGPEQYGHLRITGIRNLRPLVSDDDRADLDDRLIVLYIAGSLLAASGAKDANLKLEAANRHYSRLKGSLTKGGSFNMFNTTNRRVAQRPYISRYRAPV